MEKVKDILEGEDLQSIIIGIPKNTISLGIEAKVIDDNDDFHTYYQDVKLPDIIEARISAEYWENENVTYCLSDVGKKYLDNLSEE